MKEKHTERETLSSRLGFILLSAGCAIGIGNVWKFPYVAGQNGGAIFILIFLFFLVLLGLPVLTMEFAMGRAARQSITKIYESLTPDKKKWFFHGKAALAGNYLLMMFYTTVAGWMLKYFFDMASGSFEGLNSAEISAHFDQTVANPYTMVFFVGAVIAAGFWICSRGLRNGLEKITKVMMSALLVIMLLLAINSILTPGAREGLEFYLLPDFEKASQAGWLNVIVNAMNQAFFTLSLGMGSMAIFGSYIEKDHTLLKESVHVAFLDVFVAIVAGLIVIPACFAYDVEVSAGPSLIFITLPNVFNAMPLGQIWGSLFFVFMSFAAFSTVLAVFENIISGTMEEFGWSRKKACLINCLLVFGLSVPCALGFNVLSHIEPLKPGNTIMDFEDFLVSNILLPIGSLLFVLYCTRQAGWGWNSFIAEANTGKGWKFRKWKYHYCSYVLPVIIVGIFSIGLITYFV